VVGNAAVVDKIMLHGMAFRSDFLHKNHGPWGRECRKVPQL